MKKMEDAIKEFRKTKDHGHLVFLLDEYNEYYKRNVDYYLFREAMRSNFILNLTDEPSKNVIFEAIEDFIVDKEEKIIELTETFNSKFGMNISCERMTEILDAEGVKEKGEDKEKYLEELKEEIETDLHDEIEDYFKRYLADNVAEEATRKEKAEEVLEYIENLKEKILMVYPRK